MACDTSVSRSSDQGTALAVAVGMDDAELLLRIRVVVGSTRAAAKSLGPGDEQLAAVFERGRRLLDVMTDEVERSGSPAVLERFARARKEIAELDKTFSEAGGA